MYGPVVQDETHVLFDCPKTIDLRNRYNVNRDIYSDIGNLMESLNTHDLVKYVKRCMDMFD